MKMNLTSDFFAHGRRKWRGRYRSFWKAGVNKNRPGDKKGCRPQSTIARPRQFVSDKIGKQLARIVTRSIKRV